MHFTHWMKREFPVTRLIVKMTFSWKVYLNLLKGFWLWSFWKVFLLQLRRLTCLTKQTITRFSQHLTTLLYDVWLCFNLESKYPVKYCRPELYSKVNKFLHCVKIQACCDNCQINQKILSPFAFIHLKIFWQFCKCKDFN